MTYRLGVLRGDGIGPEIVEATVRVLEAAQQRDGRLRFEWVPLPMGWEAIRATGSALPESAIETLEKCDAWILGPHDSVSYPPALREKLNPSGELRRRFDLYANIRPARAYPGLRAVCPKMDLVIARENTEGFYADRNMEQGSGEMLVTPDVVISLRRITRKCCERIAHAACRRSPSVGDISARWVGCRGTATLPNGLRPKAASVESLMSRGCGRAWPAANRPSPAPGMSTKPWPRQFRAA